MKINIQFDNYIKAKSLLIYNSCDYYKAFEKIEKIEFEFRKKIEGRPCVGKALISDAIYDLGTYSNMDMPYATSTLYMRSGAPLIFEFDDLETNEISILIKCPEGKESFALNEIVLLGKEL